jgi:hypothetical protein
VWGGFHTRNRRRPRAKCAKPPESPSTLGFHAFTLCDPLPQANPCLHVRPGEGTARSPFVTSRSLDTRGAWPSGSNRSRALAAQRPPTLPTCNTALFVVISHLSCIPLAAELRTMNVGQAPALAIFHTPARSNRFVVVPVSISVVASPRRIEAGSRIGTFRGLRTRNFRPHQFLRYTGCSAIVVCSD